jgi:hypothetical protein
MMELAMATTVVTLKPNVTRDDALRVFSAGASARLWIMRNGALRRMAQAYVPYWGYCVQYNLANTRKTRYFAMDAVTGSLDLFEFPQLPCADQLLRVETRNHLPPALSAARAEDLFRQKAQRIIFQQGIFRLRAEKIEIHRDPTAFHVPYWLGFYGQPQSARCRVLDAVRRRIEGAKASEFFEQWLTA